MNEKVTEFEQIAEILGDQLSNRIRDRWGGQHLYVPCNMHPDHPIATALGWERSKLLVEQFGGAWIEYIPKLSKADRNRVMREKRAAGVSVEDIALEFGASRRLVQNVTAGVKPGDPGQ